MRPTTLSKTLLAVAAFTFALPASAVDAFEIQVYQGEHNEPGQVSLELHTNYTFAGSRTPSYEGEASAHQALRMTLEPAVGVTDWFEVGAYLQGMRAGDGRFLFAGWKLRAKAVVPETARLPLTLGLNIEAVCPKRSRRTGGPTSFGRSSVCRSGESARR